MSSTTKRRIGGVWGAIVAMLVAAPLTAAPAKAPLKELANSTKSAAPATRPSTQPAFEKDVLAYEAADLKSPPTPGGILFYGSSSIRLWKSLTADFPGMNVINRGFGGSTAPDALRYLDRLVLPHKPSTIVFYEGDNDLNKGRTPQQLLEDCKTFAERVHQKLPETRILYLSVKPSVKRTLLFDRQREANKLIADWITGSKDQRLVFVDIVTPMLDAAGKVRPELFSKDLLHMNAEGYKVWTKSVLSSLPAPMQVPIATSDPVKTDVATAKNDPKKVASGVTTPAKSVAPVSLDTPAKK